MSQAERTPSIWGLYRRHHDLLWQMTARDIHARYRGSLLGLFWAVLTPLLMLAVYTFVFSVVFQAKWGTHSDSEVSFAVVLYSGLILHALLGDVLSRSTSIILHHSNYVKKVVFPLAILPAMVVGSSLFLFVIHLLVLLVVMAFSGASFQLTILLFPLVLLPLLLLCLGLSWIVASVGVFIRDLQQVMALVVTVLMFLSPIFYPVSALPESFQRIIYLNPLTLIIENARAVLIEGQMPNWQALGIFTAASLLVCQIGYWWFMRTRKGFNDVV